jgi:hypothetical protein
VTLGQSDVYGVLDALRAGGDIDIIPKGVELVLQALIDAEATERIGAGAPRPRPGATRQRTPLRCGRHRRGGLIALGG